MIKADERQQTTLNLRVSLWKAMKMLAIQKDKDLQDLVDEALEQYLKKEATRS